MRTYVPKAAEIERAWHLVDADGLVLGRLATEVARLLRGKHQPIFAPHVDTGDHVVVVNAEKVVMTSDKAEPEVRLPPQRLPGRPEERSYAQLLVDRPEEVVRRAVRGMLPKNTLGRQQLAKLKVYAGPEHPHAAQNPSRSTSPDARPPGLAEEESRPCPLPLIPDHRPPQAGRGPCPLPPRRRHDHRSTAGPSRTTSPRPPTAWW